MEYLSLLVSCLFFAFQFVTTKLFEQRTAGGLSVCVWNQIVFNIAAALFLFVQSGFCWQMNRTSFFYAAAFSLFYFINTIATILAMSNGKVFIVTTFSLAGGMIIPFIYGVLFLNEEPGLLQYLGMLILCASLVPTAFEKNSKSSGNRMKFIVLNLIVFASNGLLYIALKTHQILPTAIPENSFMLATVFMRFALSFLAFLILALIKRHKGENKIARQLFWEIGKTSMTGKLFLLLILFAAAGAVCNTVGNLFSLRCMVTMDASFQFPIQNVGIIILSAIFGRMIFHEKINKQTGLTLLLSVAGIILFMIA